MTTINAVEAKQVEDNQPVEDLVSFIPGIDHATSVPVLHAKDLDEKTFLQWVYEGKPCLVKGAVSHWPAVQKWRDKHHWFSVCKNFELKVFPHSNHNNFNVYKGEKMRFHDAIERLFDNRDHTFSIPTDEIKPKGNFEGVLKDIAGFKFFPSPPMPREYYRSRAFIYRRAATAWHYHGIDETLMCQVKGTKRVAVLPPDIPTPKKVMYYLQNELYMEGVKLDPNLDLKPMIADVEEGDALYIPPYWFHAVVPLGGEIGFTLAYCWKSPWIRFGNLGNYFVRKTYKNGAWPPRPITPALPFIAVYTAALYYFRKLKTTLSNGRTTAKTKATQHRH